MRIYQFVLWLFVTVFELYPTARKKGDFLHYILWEDVYKRQGYSIYPDKEDINRFFSTLKQSMDNIDKVRMELAHKYYALAESKPDLKVDLFNSGSQDVELNRIQRVSVF